MSACPCVFSVSLYLNDMGLAFLLLKQSLAATLSLSSVAMAHFLLVLSAVATANILNGGSMGVEDTPLILDSHGIVLLPIPPLSIKTWIMDFSYI